MKSAARFSTTSTAALLLLRRRSRPYRRLLLEGLCELQHPVVRQQHKLLEQQITDQSGRLSVFYGCTPINPLAASNSQDGVYLISAATILVMKGLTRAPRENSFFCRT